MKFLNELDQIRIQISKAPSFAFFWESQPNDESNKHQTIETATEVKEKWRQSFLDCIYVYIYNNIGEKDFEILCRKNI